MAAFCAFRFAGFQRVPLDSPGTLHTILWPLYARFLKHHPYPAEPWAAYGLVPLFLPAALALLCFVPLRPALRRILCSRALFFFSVAACLVYWRYPLLLGGVSNPDEAEFTVSATKLLADPVFFRSTNTGTSGPLNIFPLALPALFGFSPDFASSRAIALVLIFLSLYVLQRALREMASDELGRLAILPALGFFSLASYADFVHYSGELFPMLLISLGVLFAGRAIREPESSTRPLLGLGLLVSAAFFSKLQSVPILAAAALFTAAYVYLSRPARAWWRPVLWLAAGFAPLQLLNLAISGAAGVRREASIGYIAGNLNHARTGSGFFADLPTLAPMIVFTAEIQFLVLVLLSLTAATIYATARGDRERDLARFAGAGTVAGLAVAGLVRFKALAQPATYQTGCSLVMVGIAGLVVFLAVNTYLRERRMGMFGFFSIAVLGSVVGAVYASHQKFPHYLELLIIPLSTLMGWLLMRLGARLSTAAVAIALTVGGEIPLLKHVDQNFWAAHEKMALPDARLIQSLTQPGSTIVVWGWRSEIYLSAGRLPATREANVFNWGKDADPHFQERFLRALKRSRAELIVDALDVSCCFVNNRQLYGFELLPEINSYIQANYVLVSAKYDEKFYLRKDLPVPRLD